MEGSPQARRQFPHQPFQVHEILRDGVVRFPCSLGMQQEGIHQRVAQHDQAVVLLAAGACLALPALAKAAEKTPPKRMVAIHVPLGMMPQYFFPADGATSSPYLDLLAAQRVSHHGAGG